MIVLSYLLSLDLLAAAHILEYPRLEPLVALANLVNGI